MAIKTGNVRYEVVAATIDALLADVETAAAASSLREEPDSQFIDDLVAKAYRGQVCAAT